ncbi:hypothetical protein TIFTF001_043458, partial [Ficus carica]
MKEFGWGEGRGEAGTGGAQGR